jgi:hypothetical protein
MSVVLYKKGGQVDMDGLKCATLIVAPELFDVNQMPEGWFLTPEDAHRDTAEDPAEKEKLRLLDQQKTIVDSFKVVVPTAKEPVKVLKGNAKTRNDAKEAGIEDWETARIATLKDKLKA